MKVKATILALVFLFNLINCQSEGGSWDTGFTGPRILATFNNLASTESGLWTFWPKTLANPGTHTEKLGLVLRIENAGSVLRRFLKVGADGKTYIPFRFFTKLVYSNPFGTNKRIAGWLHNDDNESAYFTFILPHKLIGSFIEDLEATRIINFIHQLSAASKAAINQAKVDFINAANTILINKPMMNSLRGDASNFQDQLTDLERTKQDLRTKIENATQNINKLEEFITVNTEEIKRKEELISEINANIQLWSDESRKIKLTIQDAQDKGKSIQQTQSEVAQKVSTAESGLIDALDALKNAAPQYGADLDYAKVALINLEQGAEGTLTAALNKIFPK